MVHLGFGDKPSRTEGVAEVAAVSGCALLVRREVLDRIGLLDPDYFAYFEDLDLCARARRAGFRVVSVPGARVAHRGKATSGGLESAEWIYYAARNHLLFLERNFPLRPRGLAGLRSLWVIALNLTHVLLRVPVPPLTGVRAVAAGVRAFRQRQFGARA
jgi:GT2 family glycosyltransferase